MATSTGSATILTRARATVDEWSASSSFAAVVLILLACYLPSATYDYSINVDTAMAAMPAWNLVENGTLDLAAHQDFLEDRARRTVHLVETADGSIYSNRTAGVILWGVPFYALASPWVPSTLPFSMVPAAVAGAVTTALGVAVLHLVLRRLLSGWEAVVGALVFGLGTGAWAVAADGLWPHGPGILCLAAATWAMATSRYVSAGVAFGMGLLVRPYIMFAAAVSGLWASWCRRSMAPAAKVGLVSGLGLLGLMMWNWIIYGAPSVSGGYGEISYVQAAGDVAGRDWLALGQRLAGAFLDPARGLLWYSPFLIVLLFGVAAAWRVAAPWTRAAAVGGVTVLLVQYWVQPSQGGQFFFGSRYSIEPLTLAAPLLAVAWREWAAVSSFRRKLFRLGVVLALALQVLGAVVEPYKP